MKAKLILGLLFFLISLGLGYPTLNRYDPRLVTGLHDSERYVEMETGTASWTAQQTLRVLVPLLARPISRVSVGHIGAWNPDFLGLLIVNSFFVAWALLAVTWALFNERWTLIPLIGIVGALGKETTVPLLLAFCIAWAWRLAASRKGSRSLYFAIAVLFVVQAATLVIVRAALTSKVLMPWQLVTNPRMFSDLGEAFSRTVSNREVLYSFGWLLPLGLLRLRRLPSVWIIASAASLLVMTALSIWWGVEGNVARPAFNAVGPILTLSVAIFLDEIMKRPAETTTA